MLAHFGRFHGKLPALDFENGNAAFLQKVIFKALELFSKMVLIIPRVRGHRE
jgi:hypothetical protein